jgi:hypothetical protein
MSTNSENNQMQYTKTLLYIVATDSSTPGDYKFINGVALMAESRDHVAVYEVPSEVAYQMKWALTTHGHAPEIAIVEVINGSEQIVRIV